MQRLVGRQALLARVIGAWWRRLSASSLQSSSVPRRTMRFTIWNSCWHQSLTERPLGQTARAQPTMGGGLLRPALQANRATFARDEPRPTPYPRRAAVAPADRP